VLLEVSKHVASKWIFEGFGAFTLLTAVMLLWGIKDIIRVKNDQGAEALLRSAISPGGDYTQQQSRIRSPLNSRPADKACL